MDNFLAIYRFLYGIVMRYLIQFKYISFSAIVFFLVVRKALRTLYGGRFNRRTIFISPAIYILFSVVVSIGTSLYGLIISAVFFFIGVYSSVHTTRNIIFFTRNEKTYYKRPVWVILIWSSAFITRLTILFFYPGLDGDLFSVLLFFATGLIFGEAIHIRMENRRVSGTHGKRMNLIFSQLKTRK